MNTAWQESVTFDVELMRKYDTAGPHYTSYPTAVQFDERFGEIEYRDYAQHSNGDPIPRPLSLYFHIPFCATICYYCACDKIVTKNRARATAYVERLRNEIALQGRLFDRDRPVNQLHWGGGTPTFLDLEQIRGLMKVTGEHFSLRTDDGRDFGIEIDPREVDASDIGLLCGIGFNRISLGVQDFDPNVQKAVNRIQSEEHTYATIDAARRHKFKSINVDLIYGLPFQNVESFSRTLDKVVDANPDRISVFNYAHLPDRFKAQQQIDAAALPSPSEKLSILQNTVMHLTSAGYAYIGMEHFAKPDDGLTKAQTSYTLCRNFQGYSTHGDCDLIGLGVTAIGMVGDSYSQNAHGLDEYYDRIDHGRLAVNRGVALAPDDKLRRAIILQPICHFQLDIKAVERKWDIKFTDYFAAEMPVLKTMRLDGLLALSEDMLYVLPTGRLLIRNICMAFDRYVG
jgi:oxygen-independent coproporphyrinogen-3 oxidase